jgi:hypothetical protein
MRFLLGSMRTRLQRKECRSCDIGSSTSSRNGYGLKWAYRSWVESRAMIAFNPVRFHQAFPPGVYATAIFIGDTRGPGMLQATDEFMVWAQWQGLRWQTWGSEEGHVWASRAEFNLTDAAERCDPEQQWKPVCLTATAHHWTVAVVKIALSSYILHKFMKHTACFVSLTSSLWVDSKWG